MKFLVPGIAILILVGCGPFEPAPQLYQAYTPLCSNWLDGSSFDLPNGAAVFAGRPEIIGSETLELGLAYFLPEGEELTFTTKDFAISTPTGKSTQKGVIFHVDVSLAGEGRTRFETLPLLPNVLRALPHHEETMFRASIRFKLPVPERFDFTPPKMIVGKTAHPVRTYTYRYFDDRKTYGLCS